MLRRVRVVGVILGAVGMAGVLLLLALRLARPVYADVVCGGNDVAGVVYRDKNQDGVRDGDESGVAGVTVEVYTASSAEIPIASCLTGGDGSYGLTVNGDYPLRLEFKGWATFLYPGHHGPDSLTSNMRVAGDAQDMDMGLSNPLDYCQADPDLAVSCYVKGNQQFSPEPAFLTFPYTAGSITTSQVYTDYRQPTTHDFVIEASEIGTTYGLAYARWSQTFYLGAFMRRHAGFGPEGTGAIYAVTHPTGTVSLLTTLNAGDDPHTTEPGLPAWNRDAPEAYDAVGKMSLGDLDITRDETTLWAVNLFEQSLTKVDIASATVVATYTLGLDEIPAGCTSDEMRPFGLGLHADSDIVYSGWVCSNESGLNTLEGYVFAFDPANPGFNLELTIPFDYPRACNTDANVQDCPSNGPEAAYDLPAAWNNWDPVWNATNPPFLPFAAGYPQPWIQDIVFDSEGAMILGVGDRFSYQSGYNTLSPDPLDLRRYVGTAAGDLLRACVVGGVWELESNGNCGDRTTAGADHPDGPGGGEYYFQEMFLITPTATGDGAHHNETILGGLAQVPGVTDVVVTSIAPANAGDTLFEHPNGFSDGGIRWYDHQNGAAIRGYSLYDTDGEAIGFGKAGGLGDLEAICEAPPVEIGNYVWYDVDADGIQDPDEEVIVGATVNLYGAGGAWLDTTLTDAEGRYYFSVKPYQTYTVTLNNPADYEAAGPLEDLIITLADTSDDIRDSDGILLTSGPGMGFPGTALDTLDAGRHSHIFDFGFRDEEPTAISLQQAQSQTPAGAIISWLLLSLLAGVTFVAIGWRWRRNAPKA